MPFHFLSENNDQTHLKNVAQGSSPTMLESEEA